MRRIIAVERMFVGKRRMPGTGARLECGHNKWFAGGKAITLADYTECLQGPCYKEGRNMGHDR